MELLEDKIYKFLDELYGQEYIYALTNTELYKLVGELKQVLKKHVRGG